MSLTNESKRLTRNTYSKSMEYYKHALESAIYYITSINQDKNRFLKSHNSKSETKIII